VLSGMIVFQMNLCTARCQTRWSPERRSVQTLHRGSPPNLPGNGHWGTHRRYYRERHSMC
jgi:hypothetical protein